MADAKSPLRWAINLKPSKVVRRARLNLRGIIKIELDMFQVGTENNLLNAGTGKKIREQRTRVRCSRLVPSPGTSPKPLLRKWRNRDGAGGENLSGQCRADYRVLIRAEGAGSGLAWAYRVPPDVVAR